ncbi:hypothetical protein DCO59_00660 [Helicobacter saguini]|uniref:hypothetical protein n=1 Tax=Helicobacter saguini TaxID=1548018 RepID=UPI000E582D24|nr:hypothetical protein [Helicobacter saguini]MWV70919.1 hypothetical protein [Helicobacter saguini]
MHNFILQQNVTLETLLQNLDSKNYYFLSMCGLGDTYFLLSFSNAITQKYTQHTGGGGVISYSS